MALPKFLTRFTVIDAVILTIGLTWGLGGCGDSSENSGRVHNQPTTQSSDQPKEKFFRGDVVIHKSDLRHGVIVGKHFITKPGHTGGPHDCWLYEVRFSSKEPNSPLQLVEDVGEFELDKAENK
jgi:hypothetical protein